LLRDLEEDLTEVARRSELEEIPGIGKDLHDGARGEGSRIVIGDRHRCAQRGAA
jgi:hypothetical protein